MNYRMNKYYEENENTSSRYKRNENLYREITKNEIDNYDIKSNATVIAENNNEIDIEKIKRILDTKYKEAPKRRSIRIEEETPKEPIKSIEETTKEYDINVILEKAREQKKDNYDEERLKRIKETEYNILNNLDVVKKEAEKELEKNDISEVTHTDIKEEQSDELKDLINTIALNETKNLNNASSEALDILSDLKGDDDTEVLDGLKEEIEHINTEEISINNDEEIIKEDREDKEDITSTNMINSFYTSSNAIKETDFEDIDDFSKGIESGNGFVKIIIAIIIIAVIIGLVLLVKTLFF